MSWMKMVGEGFGLYSNVKERNTGQVVDPNACGKMVYTYSHNGQLDGPGNRRGPCGVKKDHSRVYYCKNCFGG